MALLHYIAEVKDGLLLELPSEAALLHLRPGDKVSIQLEQGAESVPPQINDGMIATLREIAERQNGRRESDGSDTVSILREGRAGAMWGREPMD